MLLEVARPIRGWSTGATTRTELYGIFQVAQFDAKPRERRERVNDESTPVAGVVIALIGIGSRLNCTVDTDLMRDPLFFPPRVCLTSFSTG
ncbi:hypothetical protein C496_23638 [Natronorubrum tibetense GA33]|uniref:Uncharacterized protein n=1 Tax=Natronorubrum tibetense GA33 TaxID=1114856 RepID=L9VDT5_9EURY|nr:hypothetical protein C496_23638 [Natronorubrum tibetense GA33]